MAKLLRLRDKILIGLALAGDHLLPALLRAARGLPSYKLRSWSGYRSDGINYHKQTFYNNMAKLLKTGEIEKVIINGTPVLRLTNKGEKLIQRDFPLLKFQQRKWNGHWCLVVFDFPESKRGLRDYLRSKLVELNFGMLQQSIYISPYDLTTDMAQYLSAKRFLGYAFVLQAKHRFMGDAAQLADRVWQLNEFNKSYLKLWEDAEDLAKSKSLTRIKIRDLKHQYLQLISKDPLLPEELLPADWARIEAYKAILRLEI